MKKLLILVAWPALACTAVDGDHILGKDLAAANPIFAPLDSALPIAAAPMAGVPRVLRVATLVKLAREYRIALPETPLAEICFERFTEPLTIERLLPVLEAALHIPGAHVEIQDFSRYGIPRGSIEFARAALTPSGLWRGRVTFSEGRTAPIWARVRVTTEQTWIESLKPLARGHTIEPADIIVRRGPRSVLDPQPLATTEDALGQTPVRMIEPGTPILPGMLTRPREVESGDRVAVEISSGDARLVFDGTAHSPGRTGESILVRNPVNGSLFHARVESKGKVTVRL